MIQLLIDEIIKESESEMATMTIQRSLLEKSLPRCCEYLKLKNIKAMLPRVVSNPIFLPTTTFVTNVAASYHQLQYSTVTVTIFA